MENIARIQIVEPQPERRTAVAAAYRRGYADALEDMRKRQREKKRRRQYFIMQKLNGIALLAFTVLAIYILEGDATIAVFTVPLRSNGGIYGQRRIYDCGRKGRKGKYGRLGQAEKRRWLGKS